MKDIFMTSLSDVKQVEIIESFKSASRYLDDLLNIDIERQNCLIRLLCMMICDYILTCYHHILSVLILSFYFVMLSL